MALSNRRHTLRSMQENLPVELALFDGDTLLERANLNITTVEKVNKFRLFSARHSLEPLDASVVLFSFSGPIPIKQAALTIPIQNSEDWESIDLARYTLAFRCQVQSGSSK